MGKEKKGKNTPPKPEEDTLADSPVEVDYPFDGLAENAPADESPAAPAEEEPSYDSPAEEAIAEATTDEYTAGAYPAEEAMPEAEAAADEYPAADYPAEEAMPEAEAAVDEYPPADYAAAEVIPEVEAAADEYPAADYAAAEVIPEAEAAADEYPAADYAAAEAMPEAEYPPADGAVPEEHPPMEEATAESEPEAGQEPNDPSESRTEDFDGGEVAIICTSCTTMLLIEYDGPYPYRITSSMGSDRESYSWLLHTTCFSCVNKHKHEWGSRDRFSNACMAAFAAAILSEEFMKRTSWFAVAGRVCRKPIRIVMDEARRSVAYGEIDILRAETTAKCRMRGLRSLKSTGEKSGRTEIIDSFVPGGFM